MTELSAIDKYRFRRSLEEIEKAQGRGTELVSVYVPPEKQVSDVANYLRDEYSQSSNIKSASTRKHVMGAIDSILQRLKGFRQPPPNGLAMFTGHQQIGADQTEMVSYVLQPPEPVTSFLYRCDSSFYTEPLRDMLREKDVYGLIVIDRSEATVGLLRGKRIEPIKNLQSLVPSKHRMGGQSARRFERLIEIAAHEWFVKVGTVATEAFLARPEIRGILVGGPGYTKDQWIREEYLHHELQRKVLDSFDVGYTDEYGLRELVEKARDALAGLDLMREKALIERLFQEIRKEDGGLAAYGEDQVRRALDLGAVDTLLISEGLRKVRLVARCPNGDFREERTVSDPGSVGTCPHDGAGLVAEELRDIVEELTGIAETRGTTVQMISTDSEEGELLQRAFGGLAAILRYRVT